MSVILAIKPKYPTRKAIDKVLVKDKDFVDLVEIPNLKQAQALFKTSYVAIVSEDKYYPVTAENVAEQYDLVNAGEAPSVDVDAKFGIKKLNNFFSSDVVEYYNGILSGNVEYGVDGKYTFTLNFDTAGAEAEGYSDIKINGVDVAETNTLSFRTADDLRSAILVISATLTVDEEVSNVEESLDNKLSPVVVNVENATASIDAPAIDVDGIEVATFEDAWNRAIINNGTININKAVEDDTMDNFILTDGAEVVINLNNANLTFKNSPCIIVGAGTLVFKGNGVVTNDKKYVVQINNTDEAAVGTVVVKKGVSLVGSKWAAITTGAGSKKSYVECEGTLEGLYYAYSSNGTSVGNVFICSGATIKSSADESEEPLGAYLAGDGEYSFYDTVVETAGTGLELRAGKLVVKGGKITSTCTMDATMHTGGNGSCAVATGISVTQHSTQKKLSVDINDVTVIAKAAIFEGNPSSYPTATEDTTINVNSGAFLGEIKTLNKDADCQKFLKGGRYSELPDEVYIADGYKAVETSRGTYDVIKE